MKISLSPYVPCDDDFRQLEVTRHDDTLTINGEIVDLTPLPDGADLPSKATNNQNFAPGTHVKRVGGKLEFTLSFPIFFNSPQAACFPADIVDPPNGKVALPDITPPPAASSENDHEQH